MKFPITIRPAIWVLAASCVAPLAFAQSSPTPAVMTDTQPLPAQERQSMGAVILEDSPVIAQRAMMEQSSARAYAVLENAREVIRDQNVVAVSGDDPTRTMGGPPAPAPAKKKHRK